MAIALLGVVVSIYSVYQKKHEHDSKIRVFIALPNRVFMSNKYIGALIANIGIMPVQVGLITLNIPWLSPLILDNNKIEQLNEELANQPFPITIKPRENAPTVFLASQTNFIIELENHFAHVKKQKILKFIPVYPLFLLLSPFYRFNFLTTDGKKFKARIEKNLKKEIMQPAKTAGTAKPSKN